MNYNLQSGDNIIFVRNLLKDGKFGNNVVRKELYYTGSMFIGDNDKLPLFPRLKEIYWNLRKQDKDFIRPIIRYYSYIVVNNQYKLITFGQHIFNKIHKEPLFLKKYFLIDISLVDYKYRDFEKSQFGEEHNKTFDIDFLKTKITYIEDIFDRMKWTNQKYFENLSIELKKYNINLEKEKNEILQRQRELKLERIIK